MKIKKLLAVFAAFIMSAAIFMVGCDDITAGGGNGGPFQNPTPGMTDDSDSDDNTGEDNTDSYTIPEFVITDQSFDRMEQGRIAVLEDLVPGTAGEFRFIIKNECTQAISYGFRLSETFDPTLNHGSFMTYRVQYGDTYLGDEDWHSAEFAYEDIQILAGGEHQMTLQWRRLFDAYDDVYGQQLSIDITIWVEVAE